jgi:hypothetical protein
MDKKTFYAISIFILFFLTGNIYSQTGSISLQIFEPLPEIDLGSMVIQNNLQGAPKIFLVMISPANLNVYVEGIISWDRQNGTGFRQVYYFKTLQFKAKNFYSDELGSSGLSLLVSEAKSDITKEILEIGKLTGVLRLTLILHSASGAQLAQTSKDIAFSNPSQTLTIITPEAGSTQAIGGVVARWNTIVGAQKYKVKLNVRTSSGQSLEEALNSGTPLINNKEIGGELSSVDLRTLLEREWLPGQELVLRISGVVGGIGGGSELNSEIVNFTVSSSGTSDKTNLINLFSKIQNDKINQFIAFLNNANMNDVKFYNNEGNEITLVQFQALLDSILNSIVKVTIIN